MRRSGGASIVGGACSQTFRRCAVSENEIELGPVDYLIVEWPPGKEPTGEGLDEIVRLSDLGIIRVLDLAFVTKGEDGTVAGLAIADIDGDYDEASAALEPGASAAILLFENRWAAPFVAAMRRSGAQVVANGRIPVDALMATLEEIESANA
jgi:hypothetical protein